MVTTQDSQLSSTVFFFCHCDCTPHSDVKEGETIVADSTLLCPSTFGLPNSLRGAFPLFGIVPFTNIRQRCQRCHRWCGIAGLILQGQQWCVRFRGEAKPMVILGRLEYIAVFIHARAHLIFWLCSLFELLFNDRLHHFFR